MEMNIIDLMQTAFNMDGINSVEEVLSNSVMYTPGDFSPHWKVQRDYGEVRKAVDTLNSFMRSYYNVNLSDISLHIPAHEEDTFAERESDLINENRKDNEENGVEEIALDTIFQPVLDYLDSMINELKGI